MRDILKVLNNAQIIAYLDPS